jgi:hypothetical protein
MRANARQEMSTPTSPIIGWMRGIKWLTETADLLPLGPADLAENRP